MQIYEMFRAALKESNYPEGLELTDAYCTLVVDKYKKDWDKYVDIRENGFIFGCLSDAHLLMPGLLVALEVAWWVKPEHRNKTLGGRMYKKFEQWARNNGAQYILQGYKAKDSVEINTMYLRKLL